MQNWRKVVQKGKKKKENKNCFIGWFYVSTDVLYMFPLNILCVKYLISVQNYEWMGKTFATLKNMHYHMVLLGKCDVKSANYNVTRD